MASFSDDFNRADSSNLGAGWVEVSGDWSIISDQLSSGSAGGTIILRAAGAMDTSDHAVQITIAATAAVSHGIWARGNSNITQGYLLRNNGSSWDLFSVVGGSFTVIGTYAVAAAAGDIAKLQAVGTTIKAFINGIQRISVTDTTVASGTSVGVRAESTSSLRFDDFSAADVTAGATLGVATETDTAQQLIGAKTGTLAPATESDTAQPLTGAKSAALTPAGEQDAAQGLSGAKTAGLGTAGETGAAQTLSGSKTAALGTAATVEVAQQLTGAKSAPLQPVVETDAATPLTGVKTATLAPALEVDTARHLAPASTSVPSVERTFTVLAEPRCLAVAADRRRLTVVAESRTLTVR